MSTQRPVAIRVVHHFGASAERVFDAWLDPVKAPQFLFDIPPADLARVEIDARVGGAFNFVQRSEAGDRPHYGHYLEIDRPRRLVFTFSCMLVEGDDNAGTVAVEIAPLGTGCTLTLTHDLSAGWVPFAKDAEEGWSGMLATLATLLG